MTKNLKAEILKLRKQKLYCDECGKEVYRHYPKKVRLLCWGCWKKEQETFISENQLNFNFSFVKV